MIQFIILLKKIFFIQKIIKFIFQLKLNSSSDELNEIASEIKKHFGDYTCNRFIGLHPQISSGKVIKIL